MEPDVITEMGTLREIPHDKNSGITHLVFTNEVGMLDIRRVGIVDDDTLTHLKQLDVYVSDGGTFKKFPR